MSAQSEYATPGSPSAAQVAIRSDREMMLREQARGINPAPAGPLKSIAMEADHVAQRANNLAGIARDLELMLIGPRPEKVGADSLGRAIPPRETFTEQLNGSLQDTLAALNAAESILCRIREAL